MKFCNFISKNLVDIVPSASMNISEKVKEFKRKGVDLIDLGIGEPDFDTPAHIKDAACAAIKDNKTHYTHSRGVIELRHAITDKLNSENNLMYNPEAEVIVTPGAKQAIFYTLIGILDKGDEVLIPEPFWLSYPDMVKLAGGIPVPVASSADNQFKPSIEKLESMVSDRTKGLILNNPVNPTGALWEKDDLCGIASFAEKHNLMVISDEIYEKIVFDNKKRVSIGSLPGMKERTITVNGFSKAYAMTGWRIAYLAGPKDIVSQIAKVQQHTATCPSSISQHAALAALKGPQEEVKYMVKEYRNRRDFLIQGIKEIAPFSCFEPKGTFYLFLNIKNLKISSLEVSMLLLEELKIATVPGSSYGISGEGYLRLSFAISTSELGRVIERLKNRFL